jgi:hypothetical protein
MEDPTNSAQEAGQNPPTKVFILRIGRTRFYNIYVEAESKEQIEQAWKVNEGGKEDMAECQFNCNPEYEWAGHEFIEGVYDCDSPVEDADVDVDYYGIREDLGLEGFEVEEE